MQMSLPLDQARAAATRGMESASEHAERVCPGWTELALEKLRKHVASLPFNRDFIVEDVRLAVQHELPPVPELRVWGSITRAAVKHQFLVTTGRYMPAVSSHSSAKAVYRRGVCA